MPATHHVTGGTNGILLDALRRHRPFTPSFVGRAEDQAYLLSTFGGGPLGGGPLGGGHRRLGYAHAASLIMRHDKHELIPEAIEAAGTGRLVGDYVRILIYSAYADAIGDRAEVKRAIDPFTGCFVSRLPVTLATLRLALRAATLYRDGGDDAATTAAPATRAPAWPASWSRSAANSSATQSPSPRATRASCARPWPGNGSAGACSTTRSTSSSAHLAPRRPRRSKHRRPHVPSSRGVGSRGSRGEDLNVRDRGGVGRASSEPRCRPLS